MKRNLCFAIAATLLALGLAGCGVPAQSDVPTASASSAAEETPRAETPSPAESPVPATSAPAAEDAAAQRETQEGERQFLALANHGQYVVGEIVDFQFQDYPLESYLVLQSGGEEYTVSGSLGREHEGLQRFSSRYSYQGRDSDECQTGCYAVVFYDDFLQPGQREIRLPKDIFLVPEGGAAEAERAARGAQYEMQILCGNFFSIENKCVFTPDDALRRVADELQLDDLQVAARSTGINVYTSGGTEVSFLRLSFNQYVGFDPEKQAELFKDSRVFGWYCDRDPGDEIKQTPFIEYEVLVSDGRTRSLYYVDITGDVRTTSYVFDQGKVVLS